MQHEPRAVIFDMDGVLVLSGAAHWLAWREAAAARGVVLTRDQFLSCNGLTNPDICALLWGDLATPGFVHEVAVAKEAAFRRAIEASVPLAPGCRELLVALQQQRTRIAVGSSAPRENVDLVLDGGGIRSFFGAVVHEGLVRRGKPAPDIFLRAAELLDVPPGRCVVVEDAPSGVRAAIAAGMDVVGIASNHAPDELTRCGARLVVQDLAALGTAHLLGT
ncbi:MAG TPA: HAD family phosphatase [Planctomycetota bacterium]|nr:HAD family phosphatase [Planctomycetota bacterium]